MAIICEHVHEHSTVASVPKAPVISYLRIFFLDMHAQHKILKAHAILVYAHVDIKGISRSPPPKKKK